MKKFILKNIYDKPEDISGEKAKELLFQLLDEQNLQIVCYLHNIKPTLEIEPKE